MGRKLRILIAALAFVAIAAVAPVLGLRSCTGGAVEDEVETIELDQRMIDAMQSMMAVDDMLLPMWPTEIERADGLSSFHHAGVRASIKAHYLRMMEQDLQRDGDVVDTRFAAEMPADFRELRFIRVAMIHPKNHNYNGFHVVLANDIAIQGWGEVFPEGSTVVKLIYPAFRDDEDNLFQGEIVSAFVFHKDSERYPAEFDGWGFEVYDYYNGARMITSRDWASWCFDCHSQSPTDVVWSPRALPDLQLPPTEPKPARFFPPRAPRLDRLP